MQRNSVFGAVCLVTIQIVVSYVLKIELTGIAGKLFDIMCDYGHVFLGISIVLFLADVLSVKNIPGFFYETNFFF